MSEWTNKAIQHGNITIVVHRPVLSKEETAKRERQVVTALESSLRAYVERKEKTHV